MHSKKIFSLSTLAVAILGFFGCVSNEPLPKDNAAPPSSSPSPSNTTTILSGLQDGNYSQKETYPVEGGTRFLEMNVDIQDGKIFSLSVIPDPTNKTSIRFAEEYKTAFQEKIKGKTIEEAKDLVYVSGASLTTKAFRKGLDAIEKQAKKNP